MYHMSGNDGTNCEAQENKCNINNYNNEDYSE